MAGEKRVVPSDLLERVRKVVQRDGALAVGRRWRVGRHTLAAALAGYQVQEGTISTITLGLQKEEGRE